MNVLCVQTDTNSFGPDGTRPTVGQNNKNLMDFFFKPCIFQKYVAIETHKDYNL